MLPLHFRPSPRLDWDLTLATAGLLSGLLPSVILAPKGIYFLPNALFFWGSQLIILAAVLLTKPRPAVFGRIAIGLAIFLAAFGYWDHTLRGINSSEAWTWYVVSLPGGILSAFLTVARLKRHSDWLPITAFMVAGIAVLIGLSILPAISAALLF